MCQGTRLSICRGCRATNRQKSILHLVEGFPKHEWQYCLALQKVQKISFSLEHFRFEPFNQSSTQLLTSSSALVQRLCRVNAEVDIKSWVLDWLNGSNLRCSSENQISWTFWITKQYYHSCLGRPSTRCKMRFCLFVARQPRQIDSLVPWHIHV